MSLTLTEWRILELIYMISTTIRDVTFEEPPYSLMKGPNFSHTYRPPQMCFFAAEADFSIEALALQDLMNGNGGVFINRRAIQSLLRECCRMYLTQKLRKIILYSLIYRSTDTPICISAGSPSPRLQFWAMMLVVYVTLKVFE